MYEGAGGIPKHCEVCVYEGVGGIPKHCEVCESLVSDASTVTKIQLS